MGSAGGKKVKLILAFLRRSGDWEGIREKKKRRKE